jgi:hypothetical protein
MLAICFRAYRRFIFHENQWHVLKATQQAPVEPAWPEDCSEFAKNKALDTADCTNNLKMYFGFRSIFLLNSGLRLSDPGTLAGIAAIFAALTGLLA